MLLSLRPVCRLLLILLLGQVLLACEDDTIEPVRYGSLEGIVLDASSNNAPLANAVITTNPATSSFTTDAEGKFYLPNVVTGKYAISVKKTDYKTENVNVQVDEGILTAVRIPLEKASGSNRRPNAPSNPSPADRASSQPINLTLRWRVTDPDKTDSLKSDVILFESNSIDRRQLLTSARDTAVAVTDLKYNTTYFWQVTVRDKAGETVRGDVWSFQTGPLPDNRFLYARQVNGNTDIYSSDNAGGSLLRLTNSAFIETAPQLSPVRTRIAYTSNATGRYQLYTMNRDGSDQRQITPDMVPVEGYNNFGIGYHWSPDGSQLIYASYDKLWRINRDGTGLVQLATAPNGRHFRECDWTAQGNKILVQTVGSNPYDSELYTLNADGTGLTQVLGNLPGRLDSPSFSIDGRMLLYSRDLDGYENANGRQLNAHIIMQRPDGTGTVDLSAAPSGSTTNNGKPAGTNDLFPRFSPDGAKVIFVNMSNDNQSAPEIWTMDLDGRNRTRLFQNASFPDWK
ncbi:carboxypeptidase regulatory-like domain-containing protein [Hymenobacter lucidus]|uniref:Carboxypeptidase regulatory-like domain-containing protein n=1 Tax=Hymenobacter lucidus TaxID=2880930 RepID=A0ABS8ARZ7_9BACT|nr:carboxypeptidase regulatory-like domain-containing protein [Hymenobacter lucidus]MCB2408985.1 carboxypeptidase regulatory-like domain-containing protein [Hymenobacter lucidus]